MKKIYSFLFAGMMALIMIGTLDSCQTIEGCTDPEAENYNPDADVSDGTCTFARDKFIGTYIGSLTCQTPLPNVEEFTIVISEGLADNSEVLISFENIETPIPELSATISGNMLTIAPERASLPLSPNQPDVLTEIEFSGEATIDGDDLSGQLQAKIVAIGIPTFCDMTATRQ